MMTRTTPQSHSRFPSAHPHGCPHSDLQFQDGENLRCLAVGTGWAPTPYVAVYSRVPYGPGRSGFAASTSGALPGKNPMLGRPRFGCEATTDDLTSPRDFYTGSFDDKAPAQHNAPSWLKV
jgi:hypothetical protein